MVLPNWPCKSVDFSSSPVRASAAPQGTFQVYKHPVSSPCNSGLLKRERQMDRLQDLTPAPSMTVPIEHSSSRPTLGFPLGTALLLLVIFSLSGMFSCCYHWDRLRSLLRSRHPDDMFQEGEHTVISITSSPSKEAPHHKLEKVGKECGLPVIMPGDKVPKFFARPCPHEMCLPEAETTEAALETKCSVHETICMCASSEHESTLSR